MFKLSNLFWKLKPNKNTAADFQIGDWVYADDWCYGRITVIYDDSAMVEFETDGGGGSFSFELSELTHAPRPKKRRTNEM